MMASKGNRFGIGPVEATEGSTRRSREVGPMGAAVRETAATLQASSEAMVEQRRQNASDAKEFRRAQDEGRVLISLPLSAVESTDLPRDRLELDRVAASDEMEELKSSMRARGQKEPIEVYLDANGGYQLKKGWRRLSALRQLHEETGDERFSTVVSRVIGDARDRFELYVDMVEENVIREDLTFAEMAQLAIEASKDSALGASDAEALVGRLYASLHKMKRSYIRSFVQLLLALGDVLSFPKSVARNLGVEVARRMKEDPERVEDLRRELARCDDADSQNEVLSRFSLGHLDSVRKGATRGPGEKFEFHCGDAKVTARAGECRIKSKLDFTDVERSVLERAVAEFSRIIREG
jgi:ParB family transcriptional regulator, chromosome partitioning protein